MYNIDDKCGDTYTMYSHQKGYATGNPQLEIVPGGCANDAGCDWKLMYGVYYVRAQDRVLNENDGSTGYSDFGRVIDEFCERWGTTCNYGSGFQGSSMAVLTETPTVFNPKPVAMGTATPQQVTAGCAGGNNGQVAFTHDSSFHPDAGATIVAYNWDVDVSDGLWWEVAGAAADFETADLNATFNHTYLTAGDYTATLQVVDSGGQTKTITTTVTVQAADNVAPSAGHGGPYVIEVGQNVQLNGNASDQNAGCGDNLTVGWDLDNDGAYDDADGASPNVTWAAIQGLPQGQANTIRISVTDSAGLQSTVSTTLTIYPTDPIAGAQANPNPSACNQQVTFDGSGSSHPNPNRTIAQYSWDVDGDGAADGAGAIFQHTYTQFGTYNATLTVTDDLGRTDAIDAPIAVNVALGNQAPVARVANETIDLEMGDSLTLNGLPSSDPDVNCGDAIAEHKWDVDGNGNWDDNTNKRAMASWMVGLTWTDVFLEGNALGYAVGQPQFVYDVEDGFVADGGYAMELWYSFQVTDNIQITPAIYWLSRPFGDDTQNVNGDYKSLGVLGGLVQTTFKF